MQLVGNETVSIFSEWETKTWPNTHCCNWEIFPMRRNKRQYQRVSDSASRASLTQAVCYWWAVLPATCPLTFLLLRKEQVQNNFASNISTQDNVSLLLLSSSTQERGREINLCSILSAFFFFPQVKEFALLFELLWICFLALLAISHCSSWATCFHTEGLSPAGQGGHCIHFSRVSVAWISQQLPYHSSGWRVVPRTASCKDQLLKQSSSPRWRKPPQEFLPSPTEIPWSGVMGWSPWCINQPQDWWIPSVIHTWNKVNTVSDVLGQAFAVGFDAIT